MLLSSGVYLLRLVALRNGSPSLEWSNEAFSVQSLLPVLCFYCPCSELPVEQKRPKF